TERLERSEAGRVEVVKQGKRLDIAVGVSAVFSTQADQGTYVAITEPGEADGELFRIKPLPGGRLEVQSQQRRFTVNNEPLDKDGLTVSLVEPVRIRFGRRVF